MFARAFLLLAMLMLAFARPTFSEPVNFTVPCVDQAIDLHGDPATADLVVYAAGNQWMVMPDLIAAFQKAHPEVSHVFYETLPPGILARQLTSDGLDVGGLHISAKADVYLAGARRMTQEREQHLVGDPTVYATNELAIMVRSNNPKKINGLRDLGRPDVRVAMPNPQFEGVALQIEQAYRLAGGENLVNAIMNVKTANGTTLLTQIHHRETPMWVLSGKADAGVVWVSEALYQVQIKSGLRMIPIPASENVRGTYEAAVVTNAAHAAAAQAFVQFLRSNDAQTIYRSYGFAPPTVVKE